MPFTATKQRSRRGKRQLRPIQLRPPKLGAALAPQDQALDDDTGGLLCSTCRARVTSVDQIMAMNGRHQHAFFNPAGRAFEIRCFQAAPGTVEQGAPSSEFSWFAGYAWQIALCATCHTHLGWRFVDQAGSTPFYGLIASRLLPS